MPEDRFEEWAESRRQELRQRFLSLLVELAGLYEERGAEEDLALAVQALQRVLTEEPTNEEAHFGLMRLYALSGRQGEALRQYVRLSEALSSALGGEPSASTRALKEEIAAGRFPADPTQPAGPPTGETSKGGAQSHNLPAQRTSFVGREREMLEVKRILAMTRLLTLTGAGGSGKTRLALEVARDLVGVYQDGVWLVELAALTEVNLVYQAVAEALQVQERPGDPLTGALVEALADKELLLIVDNCEHLVEATAQLMDVLLDSCPLLRVLATSREALGIGGEVLWQVRPLSMPDTADGETESRTSVESLMRYEAFRLFVDRTRLKLPDFELTQQNAGAVARVCRKLEGMPLAIELATARMGVIAVEQVAQRLDISLDVLSGASRSAAPRQQTLRATLDWSYNLLSEPERELFRKLSVFAGGWTLEAAEAVGAGGGIEENNVLDLLGGLVDKSLVVARASTKTSDA
jgi:predicted ATPase